MKKRIIRFLLFFAMMLIFEIVEDTLTASFLGATMILKVIPVIIVVALVFTLITELVEERFEGKVGPLEKIIDDTFAYFKEHNIKPTHENVKMHLKRHLKRRAKGW